MKIMFLIGKINNIGGISRVVSLISDALSNHPNFEVHIVTYLKGKNDGYNWNKKIIFHHLLDKPISMKKGIIPAIIKLRGLLKKEDINILISCGSLFGPLGVLSTRFKNTKLIYWDHSNFFENTSHQFKITSKKFTAKFADAVVPLTKIDEINYSKNTSAKKIVQIYNPIDPKLTAASHIYNSNSKKIISVGRLTAQKNFLTLVEVAEKVLKKHPNYIWDIYGSGMQEKLLKEKIIEKKLEDRLLLKGQSNKLYSLYKDYSMMIMSSKYEGFPMTLLEGMITRLPLVSFDIATGPNEIIKNDINGFLIEPFDIHEMSEKINLLIENDKKRIDFSTKNIELSKEFTVTNILERWVNLFNDINNLKK